MKDVVVVVVAAAVAVVVIDLENNIWRQYHTRSCIEINIMTWRKYCKKGVQNYANKSCLETLLWWEYRLHKCHQERQVLLVFAWKSGKNNAHVLFSRLFCVILNLRVIKQQSMYSGILLYSGVSLSPIE